MNFILKELPLKSDFTFNLNALSNKANTLLNHFSSMFEMSQKLDLFWSLFVLKEAQQSNLIEGIEAELEEIAGNNANMVIPKKKLLNVEKVEKYEDTFLLGQQMIENGYRINSCFIRTLHQKLMNDGKTISGKFRNVPVYLCSNEKVYYTPPVADQIASLMENLDQFMLRTDLDPLIQIAIIHAQFEMIHPFLDGNGRIGRLLIPLFLMDKCRYKLHCYLSSYFYRYRKVYYKELQKISELQKQGKPFDQVWESWIEFFLEAIIHSSEENTKVLNKMVSLYQDYKEKSFKAVNSNNHIKLLNHLFNNFVFSTSSILKDFQITQQSVWYITKNLKDAKLIKILRNSKSRISPTIWYIPELWNILVDIENNNEKILPSSQ